MLISSMIIHDFDVISAGIGPSETQPELIVDPDAVLSLPIAFEPLQTIPRWNAKVIQPPRDFELAKLATGHSGNVGKTLYRMAFGKSLRIGTPKGLDHGNIITL
jgi:hypothetical protein